MSGDVPGDEEPVGSLGEEAARLVEALADWTRQHQHAAGAGEPDPGEEVPGADEAGHRHDPLGAEECRWCPVCRVVHAVRETSPEVRAHLATAAQSLLHAAAGMLATTPPAGGREGREGRVEHIEMDDVGSDDVEDWED